MAVLQCFTVYSGPHRILSPCDRHDKIKGTYIILTDVSPGSEGPRCPQTSVRHGSQLSFLSNEEAKV
jgi:hypothetical protein